MTTIDHRILIPANPQVVWEYLSNLSRNPKWQVDCRSVTFLTHKHDGPGTRWRATTESGRDTVLEITAWYNGLGYEYVYVEGPGFEENTGRIRLQEIPEGTIVQWTFTYQLPGVLGGLRDSISTRRQIDKLIADSLRKLYLQIKAHGSTGPLEPKSLMRDAPDAEARAQYQPRHPSPAKGGASVISEPPFEDEDARALEPIMPIRAVPQPEAPIKQPTPIIEEPPPEPDDTRPNPVIKRDTAEIPAGEEPEFLDRLPGNTPSTGEIAAIPPHTEPDFEFGSDAEVFPPVTGASPVIIPEPPIDPVSDTQPREAAPLLPHDEPTLTHVPDTNDLVPIEPIRDEPAPPPPIKPTVTLPPLPEPDETKHFPREIAPESPPVQQVEPLTAPPAPIEQVEPPPAPPVSIEPQPPLVSSEPPARPALQPWEEPTISPNLTMSQPSAMDTANISIWDVFGVQRPSETQQIKAYVEPTPPPPAPTTESRPDMTPMRLGLRMALRRERKMIRRIKPM